MGKSALKLSGEDLLLDQEWPRGVARPIPAEGEVASVGRTSSLFKHGCRGHRMQRIPQAVRLAKKKAAPEELLNKMLS